MAVITTTNLYTAEFFRDLILEPLFERSLVLPHLVRVETHGSVAYIPRVHSGNVGFVAEGAEIPDSGIEADEYSVVPKKVAGLVPVSNESLKDANSASIVGDALAHHLALSVARSFFAVGGGADPIGLAGVGGIPEIDADPKAGIDAYADAIGTLESAGGTATVIFMNPDTWTALVKLKDASGSARPLLSNAATGPVASTQRGLYGVPVQTTSGCPADVAYVVDGTRVSAVIRDDGSIESDRSVGFTRDTTVVRAIARIGWGVPYPEAVVRVASA